MDKTLIVLNGVFNNQKKKFQKIVKEYDKIIAVDGGYKFLKDIIDREPDILIGDFDSIGRSSKLLKNFNGEIYEFNSDKDKTDGELSVDYCLENNLKNITFIGATRGRLDQQFGNILLLEYATDRDINANIVEPGIEVDLITDKKIIQDKAGYTLSLFSLSDETVIKSLEGCKYDLNNYTLDRASSRGISNIVKTEKALIKVESGKLLVFICKKC
ncbi:MAG: thiamine diphosphokinase [Halanaerobiales bacterium]|nr:thiamine diphosphokinase [Halanaerobiales bacterium]